MPSVTRSARLLLACVATLVAACSSDKTTEPPTGPLTPTNVQVTALSGTSVRITFTGHSGDASYTIERAPSGSSTFTQIATVTAPTTGTSVEYTDTGLTPSTSYQYRVTAVKGTQSSAASTAASVTTSAPGQFTATVTTDITTNRRFTADTTYILKGFIHVANGATLTIDPGTKIKGDTTVLGSSLFVLRGAKIQAAGTAALPIVFTSQAAAGSRQPGDWGGLIIIGNGIDNRSGVIAIEGTGTASGNASGTNYTVNYSQGTSNADNSGELRYVRVEYAGFAPRLNEELNAFTFAALGSNTKLSYLEALAGLDDSFEFFGGAVDGDHFVSYESGDDHFDMSEGYSGRLQYLIAFQSTQLTQRSGAGSPSSDPQGIENDGCNGTGCDLGYDSTPFTVPIIANFTLIGTGSTSSAGSSGGIGMMLRRGTGGYYANGVVARWPRAGVSLRDSSTYARAGSVQTPDLASADLALRGILFAEVPGVFQTGSSQNSLDLASNGLVNSSATTASLFVKFPASVGASTTAADFDWTPASGSPATSGGFATFTGKLATRATGASVSGNTVAGTSYVGAVAPGGPKWWDGWTIYAQK